MTHETGRLYGLGIGPGDPELLTLKAYRILRSVPVIAYPTMENGKVLARAIVADFLRPEQIEVPMPLPFSPVRSSQPYYDVAADKLAEHLSAGRDVAVLCEGEPFCMARLCISLIVYQQSFKPKWCQEYLRRWQVRLHWECRLLTATMC